MTATGTLRRIGLVTTLAVLLTALVGTVGPADSATLNPEAELVTGREVLPGDARAFEVRVDTGLDPVNAVLVNFPTAFNGIETSDAAVTPPSGWTVTRINDGTDQAYFFRTTTAPIVAQSSQSFPFPGDVIAPQSGDLTGSYRVQVSGDGGQTFRNANATGGGLSSTVKVLDVEDFELVGLRTPSGIAPDTRVTDGSGTVGQTVVARLTVRNYAQQSIDNVTTSFSGDKDTASGNAPATIPAGSTGTIDFDVELGTAPVDGERTTTWTASVTGPFTGYQSSGPDGQLTYTVQSPVRLLAKSIVPNYLAVGKPATLTLTADKVGVPAFTIGDFGTLKFAQTSATPQSNPAGLPTGSQAGNKYEYVTSSVAGTDGSHTPSLTMRGTDGNGAVYDLVPVDLSKLPLTLDSIAPILEITKVTLPDGQTAAKNKDTVTIEATVEEANPWSVDKFDLVLSDGSVIAADTTTSGSGITATVSGKDFAVTQGHFSVSAQVSDRAGFTGGDALGDFEIDSAVPSMDPFAYLLPNEELDGFGDGDTVPAVIEVRYSEFGLSAGQDAYTDDPDFIRGGCSPSAWSVTGGHVVVDVRYSTGERCEDGTIGPDNMRYLVLGTPIDRDGAPDLSVTYNPPTLGGAIRDDADNRAGEETADVLSGIAPLVPEIVEVFRNTTGKGDCSGGDCEVAYSDDEDEDGDTNYYTRFDGDDLLVDFTGARAGYQVQVTDASGTAINTAQASQGVIRIPIGTPADGTVERGLRFINNDGTEGELLILDIVVDRASPGLQGVVFGTDTIEGDQATVTFNEPVVEGTNFAVDWRVIEKTATGSEFFYAPDEVNGSGTTRTLDFTKSGFDGTTMSGVRYNRQLGDVYKDRAGNAMSSPSTVRAQ